MASRINAVAECCPEWRKARPGKHTLFTLPLRRVVSASQPSSIALVSVSCRTLHVVCRVCREPCFLRSFPCGACGGALINAKRNFDGDARGRDVFECARSAHSVCGAHDAP